MIIKNLLAKIEEFLDTMRFCFSISLRASPKYFLIRLSLELIFSVIPFAGMFVGKEIINFLVGLPKVNMEALVSIRELVFLLSLLLLTKVANNFFTRIKEYFSKMHRDLIAKEMDTQIARHTAALDLSYFDSSKFYNEINNARRDSFSIQSLTWFVMDIIRLGIQFMISFVFLAKLNSVFAFVLIAAGIPSVIYEKKLTGAIYRWQRKNVPEERKMNYVLSILTEREFAKDIRLFSVQREFLSRFNAIWNNWFSNKRHTTFKNSKKVMLLSILPGIAATGISLFVGLEIIYGRLSAGDYVLYSGMIDQLMSGMFSIIILISQIYDNNIRLVNYNKFMRWKSSLADSGDKIPEAPFEICFVNVSFKYPGVEKYILKDLNFSIFQNEKVALVGLNGAGKSTIVKLVLRYYDPTEGKILVNGIDIREYDIEQYRSHFSVMFQDYANYAFTVRDNITMSDLDYREDIVKLNNAIERSGVQSVVNKYSAGLDTYLTRQFEEEGEELSGGEWQKICLARTFFREGDIIILDEPSAALDPEAEHQVFKKFAELCEGKGAIFISHRLSNVTMADRIIVLENGEIIEDVSHRELMDLNGKYFYMFKLQAEKYMAG
ncbi:MAG: ABC transporter ATP-binding protein [Clostridiaceae bacterium]|nr:ABC transporter ATP-binding protein [Clostridiaceae bacterium]